MDRSSAMLLMFLVTSACLMASTTARKLLLATEGMSNNPNTSGKGLFLSALWKGTTPSSSPSRKVHATVVEDLKFIQRHHERILQSVPSPGVGH
ncbi:hypothetical protein Ancab_005476 [Ancistrocladus abbreviatus]